MTPAEIFKSALDGLAARDDGLANAAARWKLWWQSRARPELATWLEDERNVVNAVREWSQARYPDFPHLPAWLLFQLGAQAPFTAWSRGRNLRAEFFQGNKHGVYGVAVPDGAPVSQDHVWRLLVWLIPKQSAGELATERVNLNLVDEAELALDKTISGLTNTLHTLADNWFRWWFPVSGWRQAGWERWFVGAALLVMIALCGLAVSWLPAQSFLNEPEDRLVVLGAQTFIATAVVLVLALLAAWRRQRRMVTQETAAWCDLLKRSCLVLAVANDKWLRASGRLDLTGSSYSATLALSLLLALDEARPAGSAFWSSLLTRLRARAADHLFSLALLPDGKSSPVSHLKPKREAVIDFNRAFPERAIRFFVIPEQDCDCLATDQPEARNDRLQTTRADAVVFAGTPGSTGAPPAQPVVQKQGTLRAILCAAPSWPQYGGGGLLLLTVFVLVGLACWAAADLAQMLRPASVSELSTQMGTGSAGQIRLTVAIASPGADQFGALITSRHWQSLLPLPFSQPATSNQTASVNCDLTVVQPQEPPAGWVEIIRRRRLLWLDWWLKEELIPARKRFEHPATSK